mgnify:CR=1 FL=1
MKRIFIFVFLFTLFLPNGCSDVLGPGIRPERRNLDASQPIESSLPETPSPLEPSPTNESTPDTSPTTEVPTPETTRPGDSQPPKEQPPVKSKYQHIPSTLSSVPEILKGEGWLKHFKEDILPFWTMASAKGSPEGNFPTERKMDGNLTSNTTRRPRMLARQTYLYAVGYLMTGDTDLLSLAQKGCKWLMEHAHDKANGGWHELLDSSGKALGTGPKWAQDTAYALMGPAACYFLTRDSKYEKVILSTRDLLFSNKYWDAGNQRIKDGLDASLQSERDQENDGGWELVAQLDQINAYMLLVQPTLSSQSRRVQMLQDMKTLGQTMIKHFFQDGIFWGVHNKKGQFGSRHVDFGHTLKTYWMLLQIDKRLKGSHPFYDFLQKHAKTWLNKAYDGQYGSWANRMKSQSQMEYNSSWWIFAEADQFAATMNLLDFSQVSKLSKTLAFWKKHYVDRQYKGIYDGRKRDGSGWGWPVSSTSKCNQWKNGYHAAEHALIMYILGHHLEKKAVPLYFAVPANQVQTFVPRPYIFQGRVVKREDLGDAGGGLRKVRVTFDGIY